MTPKCCRNIRSSVGLGDTVKFLKVIADENRLKILCMLRSGEKCVCDIWKFLNLSQNLTSHHLKVLKSFRLVCDRKDGLKVYYSINKSEIVKYDSLLKNIL